MENKSIFDVENLVALYMLGANVEEVSTKDLKLLNDYISTKVCEHDKQAQGSEKFSSIFLFSDFYIENLNKAIFRISKKDLHGERTISCKQPFEEAAKRLKQEILGRSHDKNAKFLEAAAEYSREFMQKNFPATKKKKEKRLTPEEDEERWYRYFG